MYKILVIIFCIDYLYLKVISNHFKKLISDIQGEALTINYKAGFFCYIFLALGLYHFIIKNNKSTQDAFILGLVIYGVYETTNMALFRKWDLKTVVLDTVWGGMLFYLSTYIYYNFFKSNKIN